MHLRRLNGRPVNTNDSSVMQVDISSILLNKVHVIYKDVVSGSDMDIDINHFTSKIDKFDPYKFIFSIPETQLNGVKARIYQTKANSGGGEYGSKRYVAGS